MKKIIFLFVVACVSVSAKAQFQKATQKTPTNIAAKKKAMQVKKLQKIQAIMQRQRMAAAQNKKQTLN